MMIAHAAPRPSALGAPTWWDHAHLGWVVDAATWCGDFVTKHVVAIGVVLLVLVALKLWYNARRHQHQQVARLWKFTLFFLSKRLMMIPLVATLAQRDGVLTDVLLQQLLDARKKCRTTSLRAHPQQRLGYEQEISKILMTYFTALEKAGRLAPGSRLAHVAEDMEFIDHKLVELQRAYNHESRRWNARSNALMRTFRLKNFEPFDAA